MAHDNPALIGSDDFEDISKMTDEELCQAEADDLVAVWGGNVEGIGNKVLVGVTHRELYHDENGDLTYTEYDEMCGLMSAANSVRLGETTAMFLEPDEEVEQYFDRVTSDDSSDDGDDS